MLDIIFCFTALRDSIFVHTDNSFLFQLQSMQWVWKKLKTYVSDEVFNWHCLSLCLIADLCIHFYWLSWLRQASLRKMIQSSALRLRLWPGHFKIASDTWALSFLCSCRRKIVKDWNKTRYWFLRKIRKK